MGGVLLITIFIGLFFGHYETKLFYYEESKADKITNLFLGPIYISPFIYFLFSEYKSKQKKKKLRWKKYIKLICIAIFTFFITFSIIVQPVISGFILFLNANMGNQSKFEISGIVIEKKEEYRSRKSRMKPDFELTIKSENEVYMFDTTADETGKYEIGDYFNITLIKGGFGMLYEKK